MAHDTPLLELEIDMPAILAHAKAKKVGVWLWAHYANINHQMEEAFAD